MTVIKPSVVRGVDLHSKTNNTEHHTSAISVDQLIVRRGQPFRLTLQLAQPFNPDLHPLIFVAVTGKRPSEERGTKLCFGIPDSVQRSPSAKAVWKAELHGNCSPLTGALTLTVTPAADAPVGEYTLSVKHGNEETQLATLVVLFNPWCSDDWVFLPDEQERQEYVMNQHGIIYTGSGNYISPMSWDFGQFEEIMVKICMKILDVNRKHAMDPADDVSARCNPIYVGRVVSAMINSQDDGGVLQGRWQSPYSGGVSPSHWSGSRAILTQWYNTHCRPVKYGQCWVFAGVMCSVMRLLGIPCRVVTNFQSAHDTNQNLTIDVYHADYGVRPKESRDSVWNFHVWVEGWMRRPDLAVDGKYDGWQVLDPTPQEKSSGVYCCGPAPVKAILNGDVDLKYDIPFVFAEVNADCVDWLIKADGSKAKIFCDTKRVGQNISTKAVGSNKRMNITDNYKPSEGSEEERAVFKYAITRDFSGGEKPLMNGCMLRNVAEESAVITPSVKPPPLSLRFEVESNPMNGKDVSLKLVLHSDSSVAKPLSINISVQAMTYNGSPAENIHKELKEETLQPQKDLYVPILVPYSAYRKHMLHCDNMKVSAVITDKQQTDKIYLAVNDVVLLDPPIHITIPSQIKLQCEASGEVVFMNPVNEMLKDCSLTLTGSGIMKEEIQHKLPDLQPNKRFRVKFFFVPYKTGEKIIMATFSCSVFKDIKTSYTFNVTP